VKVAVKLRPGRIRLFEPSEIYYIEASEHDSLLRTASKRRLRSIQDLAVWERLLAPLGFLRVHRSYLVNLDRVREVRLRRGDPNDWELKLDPPVNAVIPVSREGYSRLRKTLAL
jgi:DNA-binding LytR/AlgR family response regulator